jgi:hypothetical protein
MFFIVLNLYHPFYGLSITFPPIEKDTRDARP